MKSESKSVRKMPEYVGTLADYKIPKEIMRIFKIYHAQRGRCLNKNDRAYKYYGEKGIRVEYSTREFIAWYLSEIKKLNGTNPTVGRIDHSKNYSFDNIRIESHFNNVSEASSRTKRKPVVAIDIKTGKIAFIVISAQEAAKKIDVHYSTILRAIKLKRETKKGFIFKWENEFNTD